MSKTIGLIIKKEVKVETPKKEQNKKFEVKEGK